MDRLLCCIKQGCVEEPRDAFYKMINSNINILPIHRASGILGWVGIVSDITKFKDNVSFFCNGLVLCEFCIAVIANNPNAKIAKLDLELGAECIKSLADIKIDQDFYLSKEEKNRVKQWVKTFLDVWKEYMKEEIEKEKKIKDMIKHQYH